MGDAIPSTALRRGTFVTEIRQALFPSDRYTALDPNQLTGLHVRLTKVSFC